MNLLLTRMDGVKVPVNWDNVCFPDDESDGGSYIGHDKGGTVIVFNGPRILRVKESFEEIFQMLIEPEIKITRIEPTYPHIKPLGENE